MANRPNHFVIPQMRRSRHREFPCEFCLEFWVVTKLTDELHERVITDSGGAARLCWKISRQIKERHNVYVSLYRIKHKVMELRRIYVAFRRFLKIPGVSYDPEHNIVEVDRIYMQNNFPMETPTECVFREEGLPTYQDLHFIFRKKLFPNLREEPSTSVVDLQEFSDSNEDEE